MKTGKYGSTHLKDDLSFTLADGLPTEEEMPGIEVFLESWNCSRMLDQLIKIIDQHIKENIGKVLE